jgi:uncharacterized protein (UPF0332 family)
MRTLTVKQKQNAAEWLGMAYNHFRVSETLANAKEYAAALSKLYYAAHFTARAALSDTGLRSKKHRTWNGELNKKYGKGKGWIPALYVRALTELQQIREDNDYSGSVPNDQSLYVKHHRNVENFVKKVIKNTPVCYYEEFIENLLFEHLDIDALEFDFYCPKSYVHKERAQFQIMSEKYNRRTPNKLTKLGKKVMLELRAKRQVDYVLGWNNRLGQAGDMYLLFLDIDEIDEGRVKKSLKGRKGWLFKSGNGYHFIGKEILKSYKHWMLKITQAHESAKLKGLVDLRYLKFSKKRSYSTLRIQGSPIKDFRPFLCWESI